LKIDNIELFEGPIGAVMAEMPFVPTASGSIFHYERPTKKKFNPGRPVVKTLAAGPLLADIEGRET
jgi:hypothetical protein